MPCPLPRPIGSALLADLMTAEAALHWRMNAVRTAMLERLESHRETLDFLQAIPGIDRLTAASMLAGTGSDMSVFGSAHSFAAWAGLSPGNNEGTGKRRHGATGKGSRHLRAALVEAVQGAIRSHNCRFEGSYRNVAAQRARKRATVATAHQMARILYLILRERVPYKNPGTNHEALPVSRNAPRWVRQLDRFGILEPVGDGTVRINWNSRDAAMQRNLEPLRAFRGSNTPTVFRQGSTTGGAACSREPRCFATRTTEPAPDLRRGSSAGGRPSQESIFTAKQVKEPSVNTSFAGPPRGLSLDPRGPVHTPCGSRGR